MKKNLSLLMACLLLLTLIGCGDTTSSSAPAGSTTEPEPVTDAPSSTEAIVDDPTVRGLIALNFLYGTTARHSVVAIDPTSGTSKEISCFSYRNRNDQDIRYGIADTQTDKGTTYRNALSKNYDKLAVYQFNKITHAYHVGYFDTQGQFHDVTTALGLHAKTDFEKQAHHITIGFTADDQFVWYDRNEKKYYYVDVNNLSAENIKEGNPFDTQYPADVTEYLNNNYMKLDAWYRITDRIDENRYLANRFDTNFILGSEIFNALDQTLTAYVPGEARINWNAIASPDGTQIAFMSELATKNGDAGIFITALENGSPVELSTGLRIAKAAETRYGSANDKTTPLDCYILIDWE